MADIKSGSVVCMALCGQDADVLHHERIRFAAGCVFKSRDVSNETCLVPVWTQVADWFTVCGDDKGNFTAIMHGYSDVPAMGIVFMESIL